MSLVRVHIVAPDRLGIVFNTTDTTYTTYTTPPQLGITQEHAYSIVMNALEHPERSQHSAAIFDNFETAKNYARAQLRFDSYNSLYYSMSVKPVITALLHQECTGSYSFVSMESGTLAIGNLTINGHPLADQTYSMKPHWEHHYVNHHIDYCVDQRRKKTDYKDDYKAACLTILRSYKKDSSSSWKFTTVRKKITHSNSLHDLQHYLTSEQNQTDTPDALISLNKEIKSYFDNLPKEEATRKIQKLLKKRTSLLPKSYNSPFFGMLIAMRKILANNYVALEQKEIQEQLYSLTFIPSTVLNLMMQYLDAVPAEALYSCEVNGRLIANISFDSITVNLSSVAATSSLADSKKDNLPQPRVTNVSIFRGAPSSPAPTLVLDGQMVVHRIHNDGHPHIMYSKTK